MYRHTGSLSFSIYPLCELICIAMLDRVSRHRSLQDVLTCITPSPAFNQWCRNEGRVVREQQEKRKVVWSWCVAVRDEVVLRSLCEHEKRKVVVWWWCRSESSRSKTTSIDTMCCIRINGKDCYSRYHAQCLRKYLRSSLFTILSCHSM